MKGSLQNTTHSYKLDSECRVYISKQYYKKSKNKADKFPKFMFTTKFINCTQNMYCSVMQINMIV